MTDVTQAATGHAGLRVLTFERCKLIALSGPTKGQEHLVAGDCFRIGKSTDNHLVLADSTVSREHCEIVRDDKGFLLRDLGSTNGTLLDGAVIREGYLQPGAIVTVGRATLKVRSYAERLEIAPSDRDHFGELVGNDPAMRELFGLLERLAGTDATLLVGGETGTGKDLLARAVHAHSPRAKGPFVVVDCGAVVPTLIESELFGHEQGAFTDAREARKGAFELAHRGTLFLDEIGELPLPLQPKLLRALETRRIRRVGGSQELAVDLRVIAASNRNLAAEVERGKFRQDLFFRLAVVPLHLPPLRERRSDIPLLAQALLDKICRETCAQGTALTLGQDALATLRAHDWPGNARELRNVLERAALLAQAAGERELRAVGLPSSTSKTQPPEFDPARSYGQTRELWEADFERRYVSWLLARHAGNVSSAAREAAMDRKHLHRLAKKHGLRSE